MVTKVIETKRAEKDIDSAPKEIIRAYEIWVRLVECHGHGILRKFKGYYDEALKRDWLGYRSSRLNLKWRVIYHLTNEGQCEIVSVARITPHDYRR